MLAVFLFYYLKEILHKLQDFIQKSIIKKDLIVGFHITI